MSFQWTYANEDKTKQYRMTRVGMEGGTCFDVDIEDGDRGNFDLAKVFRDQDQITQLVLVSSVARKSWTLGPNVSSDEQDYRAMDGKNIVGFWGQYTETAITQIGFVVVDPACVSANGVDKEIKENNFADLEKMSEPEEGDGEATGDDDSPTGKEESFNSRKGTSKDDDEDAVDPKESEEVLLVVVIVVAVVILTSILVLIITHFATKGDAKTNKVVVLDGQTHNNSAVPQESEEAIASQASHRE